MSELTFPVLVCLNIQYVSGNLYVQCSALCNITFVVQMELLLLQESKRKTAELAKLGQVLERKGE